MTDILDLIDSALDDYEVSSDAMRWAPDLPEDETRTGASINFTIYDETRQWLTDATWETAYWHWRSDVRRQTS